METSMPTNSNKIIEKFQLPVCWEMIPNSNGPEAAKI